jgi:hypothetical protein
MKHTNFLDTSALRAELAEVLRLANAGIEREARAPVDSSRSAGTFWDREELIAKWIAVKRSR